MSKWLFIAIATVLCAACSNPTEPDAVPGRPFDLKVGATVTMADGLRLKFNGVQSDSRCPLDAQCVRAGEAIIAVTLVTSNGSPEAREMQTVAPASRITYADHTIVLTALAPYPRAMQQTEPRDYVATFVVTAP